MTKQEKKKSTLKKAKIAARNPKPERLVSKETPSSSGGIKKEYIEGKKLCKVTFTLPGVAAIGADSVCVAGDFNNWNPNHHPMQQAQDGDYTITLDLKPGREYQFRYLIDDSKWENDWDADKYVKSPYGDSDNSVVIV